TAPSSDPQSRTVEPQEQSALASIVDLIALSLAWCIVALVCGFMLYLVVRAILTWERPTRLKSATAPSEPQTPLIGDVEPLQAPGELPADVYVSRARELAERGEYREAVGQ